MMEAVKICGDVDFDDDICRVCLVKCGPDEVRHWGLFDNDLPQKLMAIAAVQIQQNDGLPTFVCTNCRNMVYTSYNFKCQVEKSDHDLRQALLLKQSPKDWQNITNVKPMEGLSNVDIVVPCYQKNFSSCMSMQDEHSASNHEQFIFEIENSCNLDNDFKKSDVIVLSNSVDPVSQIESNALQINNGMSGSVADNDVILTFGTQYGITDNVAEKPIENFQPQILQEKSNHSDDDKPLILRTKRHKCNYCIKSFANLNLLAKHAVIHKKTVYLCSMCNQEFNSMEDIENHYITLHNIQVDRDKIVAKIKWPKLNNQVQKNVDKSNEKSAAQHIKHHEVTFSCEICFRLFTHYRTYRFHMKNHPEYHNKSLPKTNHVVNTDKSSMHVIGSESSLQSKSIESNSNLASLNNSSDLEEFQRLSVPENMREKSSTNNRSQPTSTDLDLQASLGSNFEDNLCRIGNENSRSMSENGIPDFADDFDDDDDDDDDENNDVIKKTDDMLKENSSIQCKQCGKLVATLRNLKRHMLTHSGLKHNCSLCGKDFSRPDKLREHQQLKHKNEMISDTENDSEDESSRKKDKKNRPYKCSLCPKAFAQAQSLANHEERHKRDKTEPKRFLCEVCSKCFAQSGSLVAHMRTHTGVKPYVCNVCSRAFTKSTYLQLHLRIHSGEKPYVCQYCNRAFARANTLARHLTMHTGEAKYQCQICSKSFRRLTSLNEHTFTHTGQRPYSCKICGKRYNNAGSLYAHTKKCKTMHSNTANLNDYPDSLDLPDNATVPQNENNSPSELLIFTDDKKVNEIMVNESIAIEPSSCQFMIANIHDQKTMSVNMIEPFIIQESDVYNITSKQFKSPYYGLYPSM